MVTLELNLNNQELTVLQSVLSGHVSMNIDAMSSNSFDSERLRLSREVYVCSEVLARLEVLNAD